MGIATAAISSAIESVSYTTAADAGIQAFTDGSARKRMTAAAWRSRARAASRACRVIGVRCEQLCEHRRSKITRPRPSPQLEGQSSRTMGLHSS